MKKQIIFSSVIFMILSLLACKQGEQGDIGPAGTTGAKGTKGATGDKGTADSKGMISSEWFSVKGTSWLTATTPNTYFVTFTSNALTADLINKGMIYFYLKVDISPEIVYSLPLADISTGRKFAAIAGIVNNNPTIQLSQQVSPPASTLLTNLNYSIRYVAVPASSGVRLANIDWNNYEEVKKALNLID